MCVGTRVEAVDVQGKRQQLEASKALQKGIRLWVKVHPLTVSKGCRSRGGRAGERRVVCREREERAAIATIYGRSGEPEPLKTIVASGHD